MVCGRRRCYNRPGAPDYCTARPASMNKSLKPPPLRVSGVSETPAPPAKAQGCGHVEDPNSPNSVLKASSTPSRTCPITPDSLRPCCRLSSRVAEVSHLQSLVVVFRAHPGRRCSCRLRSTYKRDTRKPESWSYRCPFLGVSWRAALPRLQHRARALSQSLTLKTLVLCALTSVYCGAQGGESIHTLRNT